MSATVTVPPLTEVVRNKPVAPTPSQVRTIRSLQFFDDRSLGTPSRGSTSSVSSGSTSVTVSDMGDAKTRSKSVTVSEADVAKQRPSFGSAAPMTTTTIVPVATVQAAMFRPSCRPGQALEFVIIILLLIVLVVILIWDNRKGDDPLEEEFLPASNPE